MTLVPLSGVQLRLVDPLHLCASMSTCKASYFKHQHQATVSLSEVAGLRRCP
jgi:hypothetical protein